MELDKDTFSFLFIQLVVDRNYNVSRVYGISQAICEHLNM